MRFQKLCDRTARSCRCQLIGLAGILKLASDDFYFLRCRNTYLHLILSYLKDCDLDIIGDDKTFVLFTCYNKHFLSLLGIYRRLELKMLCQDYLSRDVLGQIYNDRTSEVDGRLTVIVRNDRYREALVGSILT